MREDLVDRGIFIPPDRASPVESRKPTTFVGTEDETKVATPERTSHFYGVTGRLTLDAGEVAACQVLDDEHTSYQVKVGTSGVGAGHLYDPCGVYANPDDLKRFERSLGRFRYEFKEVVQEVFDDYLSYLQTRNKVYIRTAERKMKNG